MNFLGLGINVSMFQRHMDHINHLCYVFCFLRGGVRELPQAPRVVFDRAPKESPRCGTARWEKCILKRKKHRNVRTTRNAKHVSLWEIREMLSSCCISDFSLLIFSIFVSLSEAIGSRASPQTFMCFSNLRCTMCTHIFDDQENPYDFSMIFIHRGWTFCISQQGRPVFEAETLKAETKLVFVSRDSMWLGLVNLVSLVRKHGQSRREKHRLIMTRWYDDNDDMRYLTKCNASKKWVLKFLRLCLVEATVTTNCFPNGKSKTRPRLWWIIQ